MCPFLVWLVKTKCGGLIKRSKTLLMIVVTTGSIKQQQTLRHSPFLIWAKRNKTIKWQVKVHSSWCPPPEKGTFLFPLLEILTWIVLENKRSSAVMIYTWKNTHLDTQMHSSHPLSPASGSCFMKSGFFLLSMETFSNQWKASSGSWPTSRTTQASQLSSSV